MITKRLFFAAFMGWALFFGQAYGQTNESVADTIDKRFTTMLETSNNFQGHKVVKTYKITDLQKLTRTQIGQLESRIVELNTKISEQQELLSQNENNLKEVQAELDHVNKTKDELSLFGMNISKDAYQSIIIGIITILVLILVFLVARYRKNQTVTVDARKKLEDTEAEFNAYRQKALETQQKLGRELQDERNKNAQGKNPSLNK